MLNILIVDDSKAMQMLTAASLRQLCSCSCQCTDTAEQALQWVSQELDRYHLIFVDLNLPGMDGMQLVESLSKLRFNGGVVIFSGLDKRVVELAGEVTRSQRIPLLGCLSKPVSDAQLQAILQKLQTLNRSKPQPRRSMSDRDVRSALKAGWIQPYFQPKVSTRDHSVKSLEVLTRINQPGQPDAIVPSMFMPTIERNGYISSMTYAIFEMALSCYPGLREEFGAHCLIALNLCPQMLFDQRLPNKLREVLEHHGYRPEDLILELTESHALDRNEQLETLNRLRIAGFHLSLDDYGTGYTNIQQLKKLPFTEVKLDRSLIYNISRDRLSQVISQSLFDIFGELDVNVVAEGVETREDLDYLNGVAIPLHLQGYLISRPKPFDEICRWHHSWKKVSGLN